MRRILRNFVICFVGLVVFALLAKGQDEAPTLGDAARKARAEKQQTKDSQEKSKTAAKPRVITDEDVVHSVTEPNASASDDNTPSETAAASGAKIPPDQWKSRILAQKNVVSSLESNIQKENDSIQFAPSNCVAGCVQWNERQKQKQADVERMRSELKEQQKKLDEMQGAARQQGYGNSVTDPE